MIKEFDQIVKDLKARIFHPIYFLFGDEAYYIDQLVEYIEKNVLTDAEKAFNQQSLYGKDVSVVQVLEAAGRLPMMANHQVLLVKEAQQLKSFEDLAAYVSKPVASTILVLAFKHQNPDKRKAIFKELLKSDNVVAMESKAIRDYEVAKWIEAYCRKKNLNLSTKGVEMLAEFLGTDISKIVNELDKLELVVGKGVAISEADIEKNIGASKDYNIFEFTNAMGLRNTEKTFRILQYFDANPKSLILPVALGTINGFFQKMYLTKFAGNMQDKDFGALLKLHPFVAKDYKKYAANYSAEQLEAIFELLGEYDLKSKGFGNKSAESADLLKEMCFKIYAL
ncbi:MAG: DNA polymerase III subunit delta [Chitinophagales bacterium]|nr:DNA polymerase III subunit delta [Chitinophagales bacterium]